MLTFLETLVDQCKQIAKKKNIGQYDLFGYQTEESSASSKQQQPFGLSASSKTNVTLRVWNQHTQTGVVSTSNTTSDGLERAFQMALEAAEFCHEQMHYDLSPGSQEPFKEKITEEPLVVPVQRLAAVALQAEKSILEQSSIFQSVPYNKVAQSFADQFYFNSLGVIRHSSHNLSFCYFYPLAQEEKKLPRQTGHLLLSNSFETLDVQDCVQKAVEKTKKHLAYERIQTGTYKVLFAPEAFLDLLQAFSNFINAQNILDRKSLCTPESLGTTIASPLLRLYDDPLHEGNFSKPYFDGEGNLTQRTTLVADGVLAGLIQSSHTAKFFGVLPTGHTKLGSKLGLSTHFLHVTKEEMSEKIDEEKDFLEGQYIYIENIKALHAGVNSLQGSFSLPFDGFLVQKNHAVSIESATVAGDFLMVLQNIVYMGNKEVVTPQGVCPEIGVSQLAITGGT